MESAFSTITRHCLYAAGWRKGRTIQTDHWESLLRSAGNPVHPAVIEFLREFGGLKVVHPDRFVQGEWDSFHLSPSVAMEHFPIDEDGLYDDNERVGTPLCAIGTAAGDRMLLEMAADGRVFAAVDDLMFFVGNSGAEAIEALCTGPKLPPIP